MIRFTFALPVLLAAFSAHGAQSTNGGAWPVKSIRFIVPFPGGSASDAAARVVAVKLGDALGQQVVVDNRAGASGNIGVELGARAAPDGYTLTLGTTSTHAVAPNVNSDLTYDPVKDFAPISLISISPYVLAVHPAVAAANLKEFIALAKIKPREISYASAGNASLAHLAGELFSTMAGVKLNHIPYKSSALAVIDLLSGRIDLQFGSIAPTLPHIRTGRLRALAVTGATRLTAMPEVPTVIEAGLRGYEVSLWYGMLAPAATPATVIARLNREVVAILNTAEIKDVLIAQGLEPAPMTPAAFAALIRGELAKYRQVTRTAGIRAE